MNTPTLNELVEDSIAYLLERLEEKEKYEYVGDIIHEVADSYVPVYTSQLLDLASKNLELATNVPDLWPAFDGSPTVVNIISANVYEHLAEKMRESIERCKELMDD